MGDYILAEEMEEREVSEAIFPWPQDEGRCACDAVEERQADLMELRTHRTEQNIAFAESSAANIDGLTELEVGKVDGL